MVAMNRSSAHARLRAGAFLATTRLAGVFVAVFFADLLAAFLCGLPGSARLILELETFCAGAAHARSRAPNSMTEHVR